MARRLHYDAVEHPNTKDLTDGRGALSEQAWEQARLWKPHTPDRLAILFIETSLVLIVLLSLLTGLTATLNTPLLPIILGVLTTMLVAFLLLLLVTQGAIVEAVDRMLGRRSAQQYDLWFHRALEIDRDSANTPDTPL